MILPGQLWFFRYRKEIRVLLFLLVVFLLLRLPGLGLPYHQDEWKNVAASASIERAGGFFSHPPLMQVFFVSGYKIFGEDNFRLFPMLFSILTGFLLFISVRRRFGSTTAYWSLFLFTICFYNLLGSIQTDVDGAVLPFLFLLCIYAYDKFIESQDKGLIEKKWLIWLIIFMLLGFLVKLNFIIVIGSIFVDYIISNWKKIDVKNSVFLISGTAIFGIIYVALLYIIQAIDPAFSISFMLGHANQFTGDAGRNYTQIIVQGVKVIFYLSPLLLIPLFFTSKEIFLKTRVFFLYLIFGNIFYFILFDFSRGALDKYLMFIIIPLSVICGAIIAKYLKNENNNSDFSIVNLKSFLIEFKILIISGIVISSVLVALNFLPQTMVALYPKTEWFTRVLHGHWNILNPFNGGSGPAGFYISFLFIASSFILTVILGLVAIYKKEWRKNIIVTIVIIGITYNGIFAEELLFGKINGNVGKVIDKTTDYIAKTSYIKKIISYNDIGTHKLVNMNKAAGRFYAVPDYETAHKKLFSEFDGYYLIIDIPQIYEYGFYGKFFSKCKVVFETSSGRITGRVYDCSEAKKLIYSL